MNQLAKFDYPTPGSFTVGIEGVTWCNNFFAFRPIPETGFSRTDLAALAGMHPRSIKRLEKRSPALTAGRRSINQRVLFYTFDAVLAFLEEAKARVDLLAAVSQGLPLNAIRPDRFGFRPSGPGASRQRSKTLLPFPVGLAHQVIATWNNWREVHRADNSFTPAVPTAGNSALPPHIAFALAAFADSTLSKNRLVDWARKSGHSPKHVELQVAEVSRTLRERLGTTEGQLMLSLLFRTFDMPIASVEGRFEPHVMRRVG